MSDTLYMYYYCTIIVALQGSLVRVRDDILWRTRYLLLDDCVDLVYNQPQLQTLLLSILPL